MIALHLVPAGTDVALCQRIFSLGIVVVFIVVVVVVIVVVGGRMGSVLGVMRGRA